jgi:hypothetical protein
LSQVAFQVPTLEKGDAGNSRALLRLDVERRGEEHRTRASEERTSIHYWMISAGTLHQAPANGFRGGVPIGVEKRNGAFFRKIDHHLRAVLPDGLRHGRAYQQAAGRG